MSLKEIIKIPDPLLRQASKPVERVDDEVRKLLDDMLETMYDAPGIGLAAVQVGIPLQLITVDCSSRKEPDADGDEDHEEAGDEREEIARDPIFLINPEIVKLSDEPSIYEEGCLSIPEYYAEVERPAGCTIKYIDRDGKPQVLEATGLLSTCLQHEIDHLNGRLFIDYLSKLKRDMVVRKFTKMARQTGQPMIG